MCGIDDASHVLQLCAWPERIALVTGDQWQCLLDGPWSTMDCRLRAALLTLKPTLCTLVPLVMLFSGQWRFCFGFFTTTLVIYAGSACILPSSLWNNYLQIVLGASEYQASAGYRSGWSTSAMTLLTSVGVPKFASLVVMGIGAVGLLVGCAARFGRRRDSSPLTDPAWQWQLLAGTLLLSPHAYFYDLVWLLLPASHWIATQPRRAVVNLALVWIGMLLGQSFEHGPALPLWRCSYLWPTTFRQSSGHLAQ